MGESLSSRLLSLMDSVLIDPRRDDSNIVVVNYPREGAYGMKVSFTLVLIGFTLMLHAHGAEENKTPELQLPPIAPPPPAVESPSLKSTSIRGAKLQRALAYHIKNLSDPEADVRQSSCEMLAALGMREVIPALIAVLEPQHEKVAAVRMAAHDALVKLSQQEFKADEYKLWKKWWDELPESERKGKLG